MHFHKYPYHENFEFVTRLDAAGRFRTRQGPGEVRLITGRQGVHHVRVRSRNWRRNDSQARLQPVRPRGAAGSRLRLDRAGTFEWRDAAGELLLRSPPGRFLGQSGEASIFEFSLEPGDRFYGCGEKWTGFERTGQRMKFWNTDVWADFHPRSYRDLQPAPDPVYLSIPYLILWRRGRFLGLLLDNPHATFISTGPPVRIGNQLDLGPAGAPCFHLGAERGQPNLYLLEGPSLPELTRRLQVLTGTTPRPPLWALGYHQCRWGYRSARDLDRLDAAFRRHGIPVDGLWLDIDYMDGYRVFTFSRRELPEPAQTFARLAGRGRRVVPVLDPGVKRDPGDAVYRRGRQARAFCENPQGGEFVGLVWPGESVFPDFSRADAAAWWTREVARFARHGIDGVWIDMNDPSTGPVDNEAMRFDRGRKDHATYHNQYGAGMAAATRAGLLAAHPERRPFVLTRSGFIGTQRCAAVWTGDNSSNYAHLRACIGVSLNLALSGIPFNGPDVGGFGGDTTAPLLRDWFKACFLFPFLRNHTCTGTRDQEPWAFGAATLQIVRHYIRLRYKLLPYLYQLFIAQEESGEAILRPLFHDFAATPRQRLHDVADQFLVGPALLQAPVLDPATTRRRVLLPGPATWWDASTGRWLRGGQQVTASAAGRRTPLYLRTDRLVPMQVGERRSARNDLGNLEVHCLLRPEDRTTAVLDYTYDDGESFAYRRGQQTRLSLTARPEAGALRVSIVLPDPPHRPVTLRFVVYAAFDQVAVELPQATRKLRLRPHHWTFTGARLNAWISPPVTLG